jgi:hypothetical protein
MLCNGGNQPVLLSVAVVAVLALLAVGLVIGDIIIPTANSGPVITAPDDVTAGSGLYGSATDGDDPVVVTARLDGLEDLDGSPDGSCTNGVNEFCFVVPPDAAGHFILITATDAKGLNTQKVVDVLP